MSKAPGDPANKATEEKRKRTEAEARARILERASRASDLDHQRVAAITARAETGERGVLLDTMTSEMAALLFINHNKYNRDWSAGGAKGSLEYERRMREDEWQFNGDTIRFYKDGALADGQGRTGGQALADVTLEVIFVFGVDRGAAGTIDDGRARQGKDTAQLHGIEHAAKKQTILRQATNYMVAAGFKEEKIRSNVQMDRQIAANNELLETALQIGAASADGISSAILKPMAATVLAYMALQYGGWSRERFEFRLRQIQEGMVHAPDGDKVPYFVVNETIKKARTAKENKDRLVPQEEFAIVLAALKAVESNVSAISPTNLKAMIKKELPTPLHPSIENMPKAAE